MRFSASRRARRSSVSSTSCFTAVDIVLRLDAMKSARRPASAMFAASVCRSSDSRGDSETTCWKFPLMFRNWASISSRSSSRTTSGTCATRAFRYGWLSISSVSVTRPRPCTMRRRLPSGSLNILWIWLAVPTWCRSASPGSSTAGSRCVNTPITLPADMASSISFTELSRATASGMNEFGNSTVSRSGRIARTSGISTEGSGGEKSSIESSSWSLTA